MNRVTECLVVVAAAALYGCASIPPPRDKVAAAESLISQATTAGAPTAAPAEFSKASAKLESARAAMRDDKNELARQLAEQAEVDAQLALTRTQAAHEQQAAAEIHRGIEVLRQQSQGSTRTGTMP